MMMYQPAVACHSCGGWGGGYYAPVYYGPVGYGGGCYNCGCETVVYDSCDGCGSCSGCETCSNCGEGESVKMEGTRAKPMEGAAPTTSTPPATQPVARGTSVVGSGAIEAGGSDACTEFARSARAIDST